MEGVEVLAGIGAQEIVTGAQENGVLHTPEAEAAASTPQGAEPDQLGQQPSSSGQAPVVGMDIDEERMQGGAGTGEQTGTSDQQAPAVKVLNSLCAMTSAPYHAP